MYIHTMTQGIYISHILLLHSGGDKLYAPERNKAQRFILVFALDVLVSYVGTINGYTEGTLLFMLHALGKNAVY